MSFRRLATLAALAIAGVAAAVGIGLLANTISGDSVGLGAEPLSAGETLAPADARADERAAKERQKALRERRRDRDRAREEAREEAAERADSVAVPAPTPSDPTVTTFDDHGGDSSGKGSGDDSSGSGSSGSSSHSGGSDDD
jgi:membrane protein involved in colicin uptake